MTGNQPDPPGPSNRTEPAPWGDTTECLRRIVTRDSSRDVQATVHRPNWCLSATVGGTWPTIRWMMFPDDVGDGQGELVAVSRGSG
jgi:hypothetical protein